MTVAAPRVYGQQILPSGTPLVLEDRTNDGVTVGPVLELFRNRGVDQVDADVLGELRFTGLDDGVPSKTIYAAVRAVVLDSGDASEDGAIVFRTMVAGTEQETLRIVGSGATGGTLRVGGTTIATYENASPSLTVPYLIASIRLQDASGTLTLLGNSASGSSTSPGVSVSAGTQAGTSGTQVGLLNSFVFAPPSGTAVYYCERYTLTVNQTGGANGAVSVYRQDVTETAVGGTLLLLDLNSGGSLRFSVSSRGDVYASGSLRHNAELTPTALAADVNDYAPTGFSTCFLLRIDGGAANRNITGLAGGAAGRVVIVANVGATNNLVLVDESASSSAANRFALIAGITLAPDETVALVYDGTSSRWRALNGV